MTVVLVDNHGYASIGALSRSVGVGRLRHALPRRAVAVDGEPLPPPLPVDLAANAESLGARVFRAAHAEELRDALARGAARPARRRPHRDRPLRGRPSYEGWWDVPVAEVSDDAAVQAARAAYEQRARGAADVSGAGHAARGGSVDGAY